MMAINRLFALCIVLLLFGLEESTFASSGVSVSGSTTVMPLGEVAAEEFNFIQQEYHVSVTGGGSGAGINNIAEGRSDVAMTSREVTPDEKRRYGDNFQELLIGYDGIGIAVSRAIYDEGVKNLSKYQIKEIYNGEIVNWRQVGGPDKGIYVISREQGSGTTDTFNEVIFGNKKAETPGVDTIAMSSAEVKTAIAGSDRAIGYLGYSYVQGDSIGLVALDGQQMTVDTIKQGSYPLARKLYLVTYGPPAPSAEAYIDFLSGPHGQRIAQENGFIPVMPLNNTSPAVSTASFNEITEKAKERQPGFESAIAVACLISAAYGICRRKA
jgi:phosphate transport system substrate-binding protein